MSTKNRFSMWGLVAIVCAVAISHLPGCNSTSPVQTTQLILDVSQLAEELPNGEQHYTHAEEALISQKRLCTESEWQALENFNIRAKALHGNIRALTDENLNGHDFVTALELLSQLQHVKTDYLLARSIIRPKYDQFSPDVQANLASLDRTAHRLETLFERLRVKIRNSSDSTRVLLDIVQVLGTGLRMTGALYG